MKLIEFLEQFSSNKLIPEGSLVCFRSRHDYPLLFFTLLFDWLKQRGHSIVSSKVIDKTESCMQVQLGTKFLGNVLLYWLGDLGSLNKKSQKNWLGYLQKYAGPHSIGFFVGEDISFPLKKALFNVHVPEKISCREMIIIQRLLFGATSKESSHFLEQLARQYGDIPLDLYCLLLNYALLVGKGSDLFFAEWLDNIIPIKVSFFLLSQYFFAKKSELFFTKWLQVYERFNPPFWVAFWSEQLWRATLYVNLMNNNDHAQAKKIGFKLPFSFIKHDWRGYHVNELKYAHRYLFAIDYQLKNGGSACAFDLFYSKFFLNQFI